MTETQTAQHVTPLYGDTLSTPDATVDGAGGMARFIVGASVLPDGTYDLSRAALVIDPEKPKREPLTLQEQFNLAVEDIKSFPTPKESLSLDDIDTLEPYTHYTSPGNLLQILRFGIQSGNFKNRLLEKRGANPAIDSIARQMCGFRFQQGASYQGKDSVCLGAYNRKAVAHSNLVLLVDSSTKVFGNKPEERTTTGYGHGIEIGEDSEGFEISNSIAYSNEVLAANIIPPNAIKGVVIGRYTSVLNGLSDVTRNNVLMYSQAKMIDPRSAKENLFATSRLIATLSDDASGAAKIDEVERQIDSLAHNDLLKTVSTLQRELLQKFIGNDTTLSEASFRSALERKFGFKFMSSENMVV